jgi:putative ubiquitin-RnfH superfamily antitoxin RatB of RatAB toxin-antitoxin module
MPDDPKAEPAFIAGLDQHFAELNAVGQGIGIFYRTLCHAGLEEGDAVDICRDWFARWLDMSMSVSND